jgi:methylglutaconyl-CoA hydratase
MNSLQSIREGDYLRLRLSRPAVRNAFDEELIARLTEALCAVPAQVRVVVLEGEGPVFCAGADLGWMRRGREMTEAEGEAEASTLARLFRTLDDVACPVVARVQGAALGGGLGLLACCDIVVAASDARFGFTEVRLGLVPAVVSPYVVRKIGVSAARRFFLTGELFDAEVAKRYGLVHEVVAPSELDRTVDSLVAALSKNGPRAVACAKQLIHGLAAAPDADAVTARMAQTIARLRRSPEGQEGMLAFLEKRAPRWS